MSRRILHWRKKLLQNWQSREGTPRYRHERRVQRLPTDPAPFIRNMDRNMKEEKVQRLAARLTPKL